MKADPSTIIITAGIDVRVYGVYKLRVKDVVRDCKAAEWPWQRGAMGTIIFARVRWRLNIDAQSRLRAALGCTGSTLALALLFGFLVNTEYITRIVFPSPYALWK